MKHVRSILCLVLAVLMAASLLCGCESLEDKMAALSGTWTRYETDSEEQAQTLLENIDLYEEEIAFVDLTSLEYIMTAEFNMDGTYRFYIDADQTKTCVSEFYTGVFEALYENRASLNETYSQEFDAMTEEEFQQFYADLYESSDFTALLNTFTENAYDYESLAEPYETGTYTIKGDYIMTTVTGETEAESLGYELDGDGTLLTLKYADATHVYAKKG